MRSLFLFTVAYADVNVDTQITIAPYEYYSLEWTITGAGFYINYNIKSVDQSSSFNVYVIDSTNYVYTR